MTVSSHEDMCVYNISLNFSRNEKCFRQKLHRISKHNLYSIKFFFFFSKIVLFMTCGEIRWSKTGYK